MSEEINTTALEPLYQTWEEPNAHRTRSKKAGGPAETVKSRRPSSIVIAQNLRAAVHDWRESYYSGASETTRTLRVR